MEALLNTIVPVAFIVLTGYLVGRRIEFDLPTLSKLSIYVLVPVLIFDAMLRARLSSASVLGITLAFFLASAGLYALALLLGRLWRLDAGSTKTLVASATFPNSGNMGLSLTFFALGQPGLDRAVVYFIASSVLMFGLGPAFLRGGGFLQGLLFTLRLPLFWALAGGILVRGFSIPLPLGLDEGVHLLGQACIPVMLLTLGIQIARSKPEWGVFELKASGLRLLAAPGLAALAGWALGLERLDLQVLVLQSAMPIAVNAFLMAGEFGGNAPRAARAVVASSVLSFATVPLVLLLIGVG
ncbi:MAG: AEC family transporter [Meiothermus sp.]|uniref:AEC family transporter n=1 Tax=Meiothermus sp. TaxID=1955249 RepID=UPI002618CE57|nr:AEC family transporter [Meiothermus sp.]MCS7057966.1 AEC family transporter [Meiothermus sp.]MCX7740079.1 AEC family transporter [Meiothermus sp.]MDW8481624.1 AEC family transporter [Meiothermus sp.]